MRFFLFECLACSYPIPTPYPPYCSNCLEALTHAGEYEPEPPFQSAFAKYWMIGSSRRLLTSWKFSGRSSIHKLMLCETETERSFFEKHRFNLLVAIPSSHERSWQRIGNSAARVCETLSRRYRVPTGALFETSEDQTHQTGLGRMARVENQITVQLRKNVNVFGRRICLVDDFFTTGSTLKAYGNVLNALGVNVLSSYVLGLRPPLKRERENTLLLPFADGFQNRGQTLSVSHKKDLLF